MDMTSVLTILANKISGRATVICLAMFLLVSMATAETAFITSFCIIFLSVFYFIMQWILDKKKIENDIKINDEKYGIEKNKK